MNIHDFNPDDFTPDVALLHVGRLVAGIEQAREGLKGVIEFMEAAPAANCDETVMQGISAMNRELAYLDHMYEYADNGNGEKS